ncbi:unnamed protein product [Urochloa decumbens]|uniref:Exocyst subunit Exo70 family protein n=1 Tax=Urochloa decumbens TaxID=240449 RepID=A0ABC9BTE1_9POAL
MDADVGSSPARRRGAGLRPSRRPSRRPRLLSFATSTSSSSTSGSVSTTYTSGSSHLQSSSSSGDGGLAPLVALLSMRLELQEEREKIRMHIRGLVQEFSDAGEDEDAAALVLERLLQDLGLSWVLSIAAVDDKSPARAFIFPQRLGDLARSWIDALKVFQLSISVYQEEDNFSSVTAASEFARFLRSTLSKMLPFTDMVVSAKVKGPCIQRNLWEVMVPAEEKLQALMGVRHALLDTSEYTQTYLNLPPLHGSSTWIHDLTTSSLLLAKMAKLDEAVWDTVDEIRTSIMSLTDNNNEVDSPQTLERSPDIHKATRCTIKCINVLSTDDGLVVYQIVAKAATLGKYVPQDNRNYRINHPFISDPFDMLIIEMISSLQENLARVSQSFPDQSLRLVFLLNNTHFMWQHLLFPSCSLELFLAPKFTRKIDDHIKRYLQMSWIPVVSCLHDPTPLCLGRFSPLAKFKSEFQKTYTAQKLWKVPDPELRRRLRKAIIEAVIPTFTKYLKDNKISNLSVTQQELEDMLQDLFEG